MSYVSPVYTRLFPCKILARIRTRGIFGGKKLAGSGQCRAALAACLALTGCLVLAGCGGGSPLADIAGGAGGGGGGGGGGNPACTAIEQAYESFQAGAISPDGGNSLDELAEALGNVLGGSIPTSQLDQDIFSLETDAVGASSDLSQDYSGVPNEDIQQFNSDLQSVANDCGTTFTPWKG